MMVPPASAQETVTVEKSAVVSRDHPRWIDGLGVCGKARTVERGDLAFLRKVEINRLALRRFLNRNRQRGEQQQRGYTRVWIQFHKIRFHKIVLLLPCRGWQLLRSPLANFQKIRNHNAFSASALVRSNTLDLFLGLGSIIGSLTMYWAVMPNEEILWPRWRRVYARIAACQAEFD